MTVSYFSPFNNSYFALRHQRYQPLLPQVLHHLIAPRRSCHPIIFLFMDLAIRPLFTPISSFNHCSSRFFTLCLGFIPALCIHGEKEEMYFWSSNDLFKSISYVTPINQWFILVYQWHKILQSINDLLFSINDMSGSINDLLRSITNLLWFIVKSMLGEHESI